MRTLEATGKSIDEAIFNGLRELQISIDEVEIDIIQQETKGVFGIGAKPAIVRLIEREPEKIVIPDYVANKDMPRERRERRDNRERRDRREREPRPPRMPRAEAGQEPAEPAFAEPTEAEAASNGSTGAAEAAPRERRERRDNRGTARQEPQPPRNLRQHPRPSARGDQLFRGSGGRQRCSGLPEGSACRDGR